MTQEDNKHKGMSNTDRILMDMKIARIIKEISDAHGLSIDDAMGIFYNSDTADMIKDKIADLHCRSDKYLAQCVWDEYAENQKNQNH